MTPQALADLHGLAFQQGRGWSADEFQGLLASPHCFLVTGSHSFALGRVVAGEAELLTIATHPDHQKRGLGAKCLAAYEAKAGAFGAVRSFLEVASDNDAAIALYRKAAYQECGRRAGYYQRNNGDKVDAIVMARDL